MVKTASRSCDSVRKQFCITLISSVLLFSAGFAAENLNSTIILNSTSYSPTELFGVYKDQLGRPIEESTAQSIAEAVQQKYVDDGFARPGYQILDSGLKSQIIRIGLTEASISKVRISGDTGPYQQMLESLFSDIPGKTAIRPDQVRNGVRVARQLPGLKLNVSTVPDAENDGSFVLKLDSQFKPVDGSVKVSNRGTKEIGRDLLFGRINGHGLFDSDISSGLFLSSAMDSSKYNSFGYYSRIGIGETGAGAQFQGSHSAIDIVTSGIALEQDRDLYSIRLSRFVSRDQAGETSIWGKFEVDNLDVVQDGVLSREDRLRSVELGVAATKRSGSGARLLRFELEQAMAIFNSRQVSFSGAGETRRPDFTILRLHYVRSAELNESWSVRGDGFAQHSAKTLPSIKRFKVGGNRIGRGFEAAAASGDRGLGAKLEVRRRLTSDSRLFGVGTIYSYYDLGAAWKNDLRGRESAASAGLGYSFRSERLSGYFEAAKPLTHVDADGNKDVSLFFEFSFQF